MFSIQLVIYFQLHKTPPSNPVPPNRMISPSAVPLLLLPSATYMELLSPTPLSIDHVEDKRGRGRSRVS